MLALDSNLFKISNGSPTAHAKARQLLRMQVAMPYACLKALRLRCHEPAGSSRG